MKNSDSAIRKQETGSRIEVKDCDCQEFARMWGVQNDLRTGNFGCSFNPVPFVNVTKGHHPKATEE